MYVFVRAPEIHRLPLKAAREWFLARAKEFELRHTRTRLGDQHYTTVGALVPVRRALAEIPGAERVKVA